MSISDTPINGVIYKTTNLINGKWYIGKNATNRSHYLGSGTQLIRAIEKYGRENFKKEILAEATTEEELNELEIHYIKITNAVADPMSYNIASGGQGISKKWLESETGLTCRERRRKKMNEFWASEEGVEHKKYLAEVCKHVGGENGFFGKTHTVETKQKISAKKKGVLNEKLCILPIETQKIIHTLYENGTYSCKELADMYSIPLYVARRYTKKFNPPKETKQPRYKEATQREIINRLNAGENIDILAKEYCIAPSCIHKYRRKINGVKFKRVILTLEQRQEIISRTLNLEDMNEIAKDFNIDKHSIYGLLKKAGLPTPTKLKELKKK